MKLISIMVGLIMAAPIATFAYGEGNGPIVGTYGVHNGQEISLAAKYKELIVLLKQYIALWHSIHG